MIVREEVKEEKKELGGTERATERGGRRGEGGGGGEGRGRGGEGCGGSKSGGDRAFGRATGPFNRAPVRVLRRGPRFVTAASALLPHFRPAGGDGVAVEAEKGRADSGASY